jgi:DNA processing protein
MYIQAKTLFDEYEARLTLFAAIEPGHTGWSQEIQRVGAVMVLQGLLGGQYNSQSCSKLLGKIEQTNFEMLQTAVEESGSEFIYPGHALWPQQIDQLSNPPIGLIVKGDLSVLSQKSIAIVGTREPTPYGKEMASNFATAFVNHGWNVVSGGALGIDTCAHVAALKSSGKTIAVFASGVSVNYPTSNSRLFTAISSNGALVSEVMPDVHAVQSRFLIRNRLIAALSCATLVVEAAYRSGSLRTARDAADLMRPVMAIPGQLNSPSSRGCHRLIAERAAEIVTSVEDAVEFVGVNQ